MGTGAIFTLLIIVCASIGTLIGVKAAQTD